MKSNKSKNFDKPVQRPLGFAWTEGQWEKMAGPCHPYHGESEINGALGETSCVSYNPESTIDSK